MEEFGVNHGLQTYNNIVHVFAIESSTMQEQYPLGCWTLESGDDCAIILLISPIVHPYITTQIGIKMHNVKNRTCTYTC